jgi:hypothetical protein
LGVGLRGRAYRSAADGFASNHLRAIRGNSLDRRAPVVGKTGPSHAAAKLARALSTPCERPATCADRSLWQELENSAEAEVNTKRADRNIRARSGVRI